MTRHLLLLLYLLLLMMMSMVVLMSHPFALLHSVLMIVEKTISIITINHHMSNYIYPKQIRRHQRRQQQHPFHHGQTLAERKEDRRKDSGKVIYPSTIISNTAVREKNVMQKS